MAAPSHPALSCMNAPVTFNYGVPGTIGYLPGQTGTVVGIYVKLDKIIPSKENPYYGGPDIPEVKYVLLTDEPRMSYTKLSAITGGRRRRNNTRKNRRR